MLCSRCVCLHVTPPVPMWTVDLLCPVAVSGQQRCRGQRQTGLLYHNVTSTVSCRLLLFGDSQVFIRMWVGFKHRWIDSASTLNRLSYWGDDSHVKAIIQNKNNNPGMLNAWRKGHWMPQEAWQLNTQGHEVSNRWKQSQTRTFAKKKRGSRVETQSRKWSATKEKSKNNTKHKWTPRKESSLHKKSYWDVWCVIRIKGLMISHGCLFSWKRTAGRMGFWSTATIGVWD